MVEDLEMYLINFEPHTNYLVSLILMVQKEFLTVIKGSVKVKAGNNITTLKRVIS